MKAQTPSSELDRALQNYLNSVFAFEMPTELKSIIMLFVFNDLLRPIFLKMEQQTFDMGTHKDNILFPNQWYVAYDHLPPKTGIQVRTKFVLQNASHTYSLIFFNDESDFMRCLRKNNLAAVILKKKSSNQVSTQRVQELSDNIGEMVTVLLYAAMYSVVSRSPFVFSTSIL